MYSDRDKLNLIEKGVSRVRVGFRDYDYVRIPPFRC